MIFNALIWEFYISVTLFVHVSTSKHELLSPFFIYHNLPFIFTSYPIWYFNTLLNLLVYIDSIFPVHIFFKTNNIIYLWGFYCEMFKTEFVRPTVAKSLLKGESDKAD